MPQRTLGRGFVQPGNVENTGAAPTHSKVTPVSQSPWLSRPRVLYIPFSVRRKEHPDYKPRRGHWVRRLLKDQVEQLIEQTRKECAGKAQAQAVEKELGYFVNNVERMQYGTFRRRGFFIGSGVVEAGCKTVIGARCKQSGMFWGRPGAENILALRCIHAAVAWSISGKPGSTLMPPAMMPWRWRRSRRILSCAPATIKLSLGLDVPQDLRYHGLKYRFMIKIFALLLSCIAMSQIRAATSAAATMRVAVVQMRSSRSIAENLSSITNAIHKCAGKGARVVVFPECALSGYFGEVMMKLSAGHVRRPRSSRSLRLAMPPGFTPWSAAPRGTAKKLY